MLWRLTECCEWRKLSLAIHFMGPTKFFSTVTASLLSSRADSPKSETETRQPVSTSMFRAQSNPTSNSQIYTLCTQNFLNSRTNWGSLNLNYYTSAWLSKKKFSNRVREPQGARRRLRIIHQIWDVAQILRCFHENASKLFEWRKKGRTYKKKCKKILTFVANNLIGKWEFCQIMIEQNIRCKGNPL